MKIKEVVKEGIVGAIGDIAKGAVTGAVKGVGQAVAPDSTARLTKRLGGNKNFELPPIISDKEVELNSIIDELIKKAGSTRTVSMDDIEAAVRTGLSEATKQTPVQQAEIDYIAAVLATKGIKVSPSTTPSTETEKTLPAINKELAGRGIKVITRIPLRLQFQGQVYEVGNNKVENIKHTAQGLPIATSPKTQSFLLDIAAEVNSIDPLPPQAATTQQKQPASVQPGPTDATPIGTVQTPKGYAATKWSDGVWTYVDPTDKANVIVKVPDYITKLEALLAKQPQEEPAVFTSNRRE